MALELGREETPRFTEEVKARLEAHSWPGNIRELKSTVERAVYRSDSSLIREVDLNPFRSNPSEDGLRPTPQGRLRSGSAQVSDKLLEMPFEEAVEELKIRLLKKALFGARFNQQKAAKALGLSYHQFRGLYRKYHRRLDSPSGQKT
jgi:psp operon transcriptional activator